MPAQSNVNDVRAYLKELQIKNGWAADFLLVDYLDLLMSVSAKVFMICLLRTNMYLKNYVT